MKSIHLPNQCLLPAVACRQSLGNNLPSAFRLCFYLYTDLSVLSFHFYKARTPLYNCGQCGPYTMSALKMVIVCVHFLLRFSFFFFSLYLISFFFFFFVTSICWYITQGKILRQIGKYKYLDTVITSDGRCTEEIKAMIAMADIFWKKQKIY